MNPIVLKSNKNKNDKVYLNGEAYIKDGANKDGTRVYYACVK